MVENCYNAGTINSNNGTAGGIIGNTVEVLTIVENCYNIGDVRGDMEAGGIVGMNDLCNIRNCYNIGDIIGKRLVGSIAGSVDRYYKAAENCYYKIGCAKDETGTVQNGLGVPYAGQTAKDIDEESKGLSDEEMLLQASFENFDFENVWTMEGDPDSTYPELLGMYKKQIFEKPDESNLEKTESTEEITPIVTEDGGVIGNANESSDSSVIYIALATIVAIIVIGAVCFFKFRKKQ